MSFHLNHMYTYNYNGRKTHTPNSTYKKSTVQWLNEALCFVSSFEVPDSLVLLNGQLLVAAKPLPVIVDQD